MDDEYEKVTNNIEEFNEEIRKLSEEFQKLRKEMRSFSRNARSSGRKNSSEFGLQNVAEGVIGKISKLAVSGLTSSDSAVQLASNGDFGLSAKNVNYMSNFATKLISQNLFGARKNGGIVAAGSSYLVGENGPEIFSPQNSGQIIPNGRISNASQSQYENSPINVNVNVATNDSSSFMQTRGQIMTEITAAMRKNRLL